VLKILCVYGGYDFFVGLPDDVQENRLDSELREDKVDDFGKVNKPELVALIAHMVVKLISKPN